MAYCARPTIIEDLATLQQRMRCERNADRKRRLHMLVLFAQDNPPTRQQVAEHLGVERKAIRRWLARYQRGGIEALLSDETPGRKPGQRLLPSAVLERLQERLNTDDGFASYVEAQQWLATEFDEHVNYTSLHGLIRYRLKAKLKAPRPEHPKKN